MSLPETAAAVWGYALAQLVGFVGLAGFPTHPAELVAARHRSPGAGPSPQRAPAM